MTGAEMNRRIAEKVCGWRDVQIFEIVDGTPRYVGRHPNHISGNLPDYCTDRNAVAEMEEAIEAAGLVDAYLFYLCKACEVRYDTWEIGHFYTLSQEEVMKIRTAPPVLCAEACLRAFGLWEEGETE